MAKNWDGKGRVIVVTGATDGIGRETALELARAGAHVLVHGRTREKAERTAHELARTLGSAERFEPCAADLSSLAEVRRLGEALAARPRVDVLVNNAGVFMHERVLTADGYETTFAVNHLAHFLLTLLALPALRKSEQGRVVHVSSGAHTGGHLDFDDLDAARRFDGYQAYSTSKLANVLFSNELARRLAGTHVTSNALHPGVIGTKLLREGWGSGGASLARGAATSLKLSLDPALAATTGRFFSDERETTPSTEARNERVAQRLWDVSVERTGAPELPRP